MGARQDRLYIHTVAIYNPLPITPGEMSLGDVEELKYSSTPSVASQRCYKESYPETEKGTPFGRKNTEDTVSLIDQFHFDTTADVRPNARLLFTKTGHPDTNTWWAVSGDNKAHNFRAGAKTFYCTRSTKPKLV